LAPRHHRVRPAARTATSRTRGRKCQTTSGCTSLKSDDAAGRARTTGPSARSRTRGKRLEDATRDDSTTAARRARSSARGAARDRTRASFRTACSSAGCTRAGTARSCARTVPRAVAARASSRITRRSCGRRRTRSGTRSRVSGGRRTAVRLLPIRPRSRGARRSLRTFPVVTFHPRFPFNV